MAAHRSDAVDWTDPSCPVARTVDLVGDRWSLLIIRDAMDGAASFTDFHKRLGIARNILSDRLGKLVDRGILTTRTAPGGKRHMYELTQAGEDLFPAIVALRQWGERHALSPGEQHSILTDQQGGPVATLSVHGQDGKLLTPAAARVHKIG